MENHPVLLLLAAQDVRRPKGRGLRRCSDTGIRVSDKPFSFQTRISPEGTVGLIGEQVTLRAVWRGRRWEQIAKAQLH